MIDEKDFKSWLRNKRQLKESSIKKYTFSLLQISSFLVDENLIQSSIYEVDDVGSLKGLIDTYLNNQENREKDERGNRMWSAAANRLIECMEFNLSSVNMEVSFPATFDQEELDRSVKTLLEKGGVGKPKGNKKPKTSKQNITVIARDPNVIVWVLLNAGDECEDCNEKAPFKREKDNTPYLEVHHVVELKNGGPDTIDNAIALCPNCHRKAHYSNDRKLFVKKLKEIAVNHI